MSKRGQEMNLRKLIGVFSIAAIALSTISTNALSQELVNDTFTGDNGTLLANHTPDSRASTAQAWADSITNYASTAQCQTHPLRILEDQSPDGYIRRQRLSALHAFTG